MSIAPPIEDYALLGDGRSAALISKAGAIDWLCWPRFDSPAVFAALLGSEEHGTWRIAPVGAVLATHRRYRPGSMVLETEIETATGRVALIDCMVVDAVAPILIRTVEGRGGEVGMRMAMRPRFGYGAALPALRPLPDGGICAQAGAEMAVLHANIAMRVENLAVLADFALAVGQRVAFSLCQGAAHMPPPDIPRALAATDAFWRGWCAGGTYRGPYAAAVARSALTLKALSHASSGAIIAAPTTSLPEQPGGARNWDYRYCWPRDASFAVHALWQAGFRGEAAAWFAWLARTLGTGPAHLQPVYGLDGEHDIPEWEAPWLPGYQGARPVRIGNAAAGQSQIDVYGEVLDAMRHAGPAHAGLRNALAGHLATIWNQPDDGIWEVRGGRQHFTHSKVMAWVGIDRAIRATEAAGVGAPLAAPLAAWRELRARIHADVCTHGFNTARGSFTQTYGGTALDAGLLLMPVVGFLPAADPRMRATIAAIERELMLDGLVLRYRDDAAPDGLSPGEGAFLPCSFWLVDNYILQGRLHAAEALFTRLLALRNDVGLLAEEYDPRAGRMLGNFPQALSHAGLIRSALNLAGA